MELHTGDTLKVTLGEKPSTGYRWEVASGDTAILKQVGGREFKYDIVSYITSLLGVVGGDSGEATFRFAASTSGQTVLKLVLRRPGDGRLLGTYEVTVVVK
ncbi:MAG: protease inhibitor I42 family protein [Chloroflexota bacterium]